MRTAVTTLLLSLLASAAGCKGALPDHWDQALVLENSRFRLETDLDRQKAETHFVQLNAIHEEYLARFRLEASHMPDNPLTVRVFKSILDFSEHTGLTHPLLDKLRRMKEEADARGRPMTITVSRLPGGQYFSLLGSRSLSLFDSDRTGYSMRHELAHYFMDVKSRPARWFNEGMAEYLAKNSSGEVFRALTSIERRVKAGDRLRPLSEVVTLGRVRQPLEYLQVWVVAFYLLEISRDVTVHDYGAYQERADTLARRKTFLDLVRDIVQTWKGFRKTY